MAPRVEKRLFEQWKDGLTRSTGPRRADGGMDRGWRCPRASTAASSSPPMPLGALLQQERGGWSRDAASQPRSPQNACNNPHRASSDPGSDAGSVPGQEGVEGCCAGGGLWWGDSSHWDMAGTGSVLQMSPLQIPASLQVVTNAPARLWNSPGVQQCHKVSPAPREPPAPLQCARSFGAGIIEGAHRY